MDSSLKGHVLNGISKMKGEANFRKVNLKRKMFSRSKRGGQPAKRFKKRLGKYIRDNPENKVAKEKEKDAYHFTDSEESEDDLGMGLELSDLPFLDDNHTEKQKDLIALTQDTVRPFFANESSYDDEKLNDALVELRYRTFRPNQKEAIKRILLGRSTLFVSPTGSGKSLCYQLPALLYWRYRKYITIVVSPLISLMEDQMNHIPSVLKAVCLHSGQNRTQRQRAIEHLSNGEAQIVFISPEAIVGGLLNLDDLRNLPPVGFVCIDEAHCLSDWSHNFRPAYLQFFRILYEQLGIKTYLGLTATATRATSFAVARALTINPEYDVIGSTTVPENLILSVSYESNKEKALIDLLKSPTFRIMTSIIVYCNRREETEHVASRIRTAMQAYVTLVEVPERKKSAPSETDNLNSSSDSSSHKAHMKLSWHAESYHAGLSSETRRRIQRQFIKGEIRVVVATIAFGMGINKANVRAIIHYDMPASFESYVQEIGRAGRDGKPAQCHMFLNADMTDIYYQQRHIYASVPERKNLRKLTDMLFVSCPCKRITKEDEVRKLDMLNERDKHEISNWHRTSFTNEPTVGSEDDLDDFRLLTNENETSEKENKPVKYVRNSIVKKHRPCKGHEVAFSLESAANAINLSPESIITLICILEQAYPQLKLKQFTPIKPQCNLFCYKGPSQLEALAKTSPAVKVALDSHNIQQIRTTGSRGETPNKLTFDVLKVATRLAKPYGDVVRMLKKCEWELVEKTGSFRRSQVKVSFEGNSFHIRAIGDLEEKELEELNNFLYDTVKLRETIERERVAKVYHTLKNHSINVEQMKDKILRLDVSRKLKMALNNHFDLSLEPNPTPVGEANDLNESNGKYSEDKLSSTREQLIRKSARAFISAHGKDWTPRAIAKIFQGISTPNHPAEIWGMNKKWWRIHLDIDFLRLTSIIQEELLS